MRIGIVNGPNLRLLGRREPEIYGTATLDDICEALRTKAAELGVEVDFFQSDSEGEICAKLGDMVDQWDGVVINPAAYTHSSLAIQDALKGTRIPTVEVHLSNVFRRESIRSNMVTTAACLGVISGFGTNSYLLALEALVHFLRMYK